MLSTLGFFNLGGWEIALLALAALLIFGKRLPEVGKSLGKGIVEFKKGLHGIQDDIDKAGKTDTDSNAKIEEKNNSTINESSTESTTKST